MIAPEQICDWILADARLLGAEYPTFAESTEGQPVIVDTASGKTYRIALEEF